MIVGENRSDVKLNEQGFHHITVGVISQRFVIYPFNHHSYFDTKTSHKKDYRFYGTRMVRALYHDNN